MSIVTNPNVLSDEDTNLINEELKINIDDKYSFGPTRYFIPYDLSEDGTLKLPLAYASRRLKLKRRTRDEFASASVEFAGVLRDEQKVVKTEAIKTLNNQGSVILSMYCVHTSTDEISPSFNFSTSLLAVRENISIILNYLICK